MHVPAVINPEKMARGPFQSGLALVHTARTQGPLPGLPSQEASGSVARRPRALARFASVRPGRRTTVYRGVEQPGSSSGS
jgi:hypothetical protein